MKNIRAYSALNPDSLYSPDVDGETFFYTVKGNLFTGHSNLETHFSMLSNYKDLFYECFPNSEKCFNSKEERNYFLNKIFSNVFLKKIKDNNLECSKNDTLDMRILKYLKKNNISLDEIQDFNANLHARYKAMMFGNILGRYGVLNDNCFIAIWNRKDEINPSLLKKFFNDSELFDQLKIFFKDYPSNEWDVVFDNRDFQFFEELSSFRYKSKTKKPIKKKTIINTGDTREIMPEDKIKILDKEFTIQQLQKMRSNMHIGSKIPDPTIPLHPSQYFSYLCSIDAKKYPQLSGYRPVDCPSNQKAKYEPTMRDAMKKAGYPYYKTYGESFKNWLKSIE